MYPYPKSFCQSALNNGMPRSKLPYNIPNSYSKPGALPNLISCKSDFSTWTKSWVYMYMGCAHIVLDACKWNTVPFPDCYLHFLCYHTTNSKKLWWRSGNETVMMVWEWDRDGGLGMSETVMEAWELGCDGGVGMRPGWRTANVVKANTHIPLSKDIPTYAAILNKNTSSVYGALVPKLLPSFSPPLYPPF